MVSEGWREYHSKDTAGYLSWSYSMRSHQHTEDPSRHEMVWNSFGTNEDRNEHKDQALHPETYNWNPWRKVQGNEGGLRTGEGHLSLERWKAKSILASGPSFCFHGRHMWLQLSVQWSLKNEFWIPQRSRHVLFLWDSGFENWESFFNSVGHQHTSSQTRLGVKYIYCNGSFTRTDFENFTLGKGYNNLKIFFFYSA